MVWVFVWTVRPVMSCCWAGPFVLGAEKTGPRWVKLCMFWLWRWVARGSVTAVVLRKSSE